MFNVRRPEERLKVNDNLTYQLPPPHEIALRIEACREEMASLKKLLRICVAAHKAEEARRRREPTNSRLRKLLRICVAAHKAEELTNSR